MKFLTLVMLMISFNAFACWNMKAILSVDKNSVSINQKFNHDQVYSFPSGNLIYNVTVPSAEKWPTQIPKNPNGHMIQVNVVEKEGMTLRPVTQGMMIVALGKEAIMTKEDNETKQVTTFKLTLTEI